MVEAKTDYFGLMTSEDVDDIEGEEIQDAEMIVIGKGSNDVLLSIV